MSRRLATTALALLLPLGLVGCGSGSGSGGTTVVTSSYPLQFLADRLVGKDADVVNLVKPGVEPHELEMSPRATAQVAEADLVVYEKGLAPSVDDAVAQQVSKDHRLDVSGSADLAGDDPHFWLDPVRMRAVAATVSARLQELLPEQAGRIRQRGEKLAQDLAQLDRDYAEGLRTCRTRAVVVSHDAFEYLGRRYRLDVHAIAGLSPDAEPSARRLAELATLAREDEVTTIFSERLASPKLAETLASEAGVRTAVLDPVEGLTSEDSGEDYLSLMRQNLAALVKAGSCS